MAGLGTKLRNMIKRTNDSVEKSFVQNYYVNGWDGSDANAGTDHNVPFLTMEKALSVCSSGATVYLVGTITESITAPLGLFDITIKGVISGAPRQATDGGEQAGYSAYWVYASDSTVANLTLREQGWRIENVCFLPPASTAATAAGIRFLRDGSTNPDPSHAVIENCYFSGGGNGIADTGGSAFLRLYDNVFRGQTGFCIKNFATGVAVPLHWHVKRNRFLNFINGVYVAFSYGVIEENIFSDGGTPNTTCVLDVAGHSTQGANNFVINNYFQTTTGNFNTPDIIGSSTDVWRNFSFDGADLNAGSIGLEIGQPS